MEAKASLKACLSTSLSKEVKEVLAIFKANKSWALWLAKVILPLALTIKSPSWECSITSSGKLVIEL